MVNMNLTDRIKPVAGDQWIATISEALTIFPLGLAIIYQP